MAIRHHRVTSGISNPSVEVDLAAWNEVHDQDAASTTVAGPVAFATDAEAQAMASTSKVLTASNLAAIPASTTAQGLAALATNAVAQAMASTTKTLTPSNLAAVLAVDVQTFTASGTWTKPAAGRVAIVQIIGSGGGGARRSAGNGSGGGGGAFFEKTYFLSDLSATETITIGTGGAVQSTDSTNGNNGGNTSFGSHITIYGARGGSQAAAGNAVSGGGSATFTDTWSAGSTTNVGFLAGVVTAEAQNGTFSTQWGANATGTTAGNIAQVIGIVALNGGAGGSGHSTTGPVSGTANTSLNGGNGGAGNGAGAGGNGASPGGGGGSGTTQGGSGADGRIIITVF